MRPLGGHRRPPGTASNTAATISLSSKAEDLKSLLETAAAILVLAHQVQQHQQHRKRKVAKELKKKISIMWRVWMVLVLSYIHFYYVRHFLCVFVGVVKNCIFEGEFGKKTLRAASSSFRSSNKEFIIAPPHQLMLPLSYAKSLIVHHAPVFFFQLLLLPLK